MSSLVEMRTRQNTPYKGAKNEDIHGSVRDKWEYFKPQVAYR